MTGQRWYYIVPFDPKSTNSWGPDHAGTGGYFDSLVYAIVYADAFRRQCVRKYAGHRRVLPVKIVNVHHETVATIGRGFKITWTGVSA